MKLLSNRNFILLLIISLLVFRFSFLSGSAELLLLYVRLLLTDFEFASGQLNFQLADTFLSLIFFLICIAGLLFLYNRRQYLKENVTLQSAVIIVLVSFFFFAPAISSFNPEFQKNISVTKLLPPFSRVTVIKTKLETALNNIKEEFLSKKKDVVKLPFDDNIIFVSRVKESGTEFSYYQNNKEFKLDKKPEVLYTYFLLGTDQYGRDIFSRLIYGARVSLFVGLGAVIVSFLIGFILGFAAGYPAGIIDVILNRIADIFLSFPVIFLIILILALFGNSLITVVVVLGLSGWMTMFKIVRSEIMGIKKKDYFISARMTGLSFYELMFKEALPVIAVPVIINLIFQFANVIMAEAALSYLGLGTGGIYPSWGSMIESSQSYLPEAWWMIIAPAVLLILTLYTANTTGRTINQKILRKAYD